MPAVARVDVDVADPRERQPVRDGAQERHLGAVRSERPTTPNDASIALLDDLARTAECPVRVLGQPAVHGVEVHQPPVGGQDEPSSSRSAMDADPTSGTRRPDTVARCRRRTTHEAGSVRALRPDPARPGRAGSARAPRRHQPLAVVWVVGKPLRAPVEPALDDAPRGRLHAAPPPAGGHGRAARRRCRHHEPGREGHGPGGRALGRRDPGRRAARWRGWPPGGGRPSSPCWG